MGHRSNGMNNAHTSFSGVRPQDWGNTLSVCLGLILMLALVLPAWAVDPPLYLVFCDG